MNWWQFAIVASIAWIVLVVAFSTGLLWHISKHPLAPKAEEAREEFVSGLIGMVLGGGLGAIWVGAFIWHKIRGARQAETSNIGAGSPDFAPCPTCSSRNARKVTYTWWGGLLGPALFHHVKCLNCGAGFNSRTGKSNAVPIAIYI